jgi:hypothetical protein
MRFSFFRFGLWRSVELHVDDVAKFANHQVLTEHLKPAMAMKMSMKKICQNPDDLICMCMLYKVRQ